MATANQNQNRPLFPGPYLPPDDQQQVNSLFPGPFLTPDATPFNPESVLDVTHAAMSEGPSDVDQASAIPQTYKSFAAKPTNVTKALATMPDAPAAPPQPPPMPSLAAPVPTLDEDVAAHGHAPVPGAPPQYHGKKLAAMGLFAGLDSIGAALTGNRATVAPGLFANAQENIDYQRNLPVLQHNADIAAYNERVKGLEAGADVGLKNAQTYNLQQNNPLIPRAVELRNSIEQMWRNNQMSPQDFDKWAATQLAGRPEARLIDAASGKPFIDVNAIKQLPQQKPYKVNLQDDLPTGVSVYNQNTAISRDPKTGAANGFIVNGKTVPFNDPSLPPELQSAVPDITAADQAHQTKRGEKLQDEETVAGFTADRQGKQIQAAINSAQKAEDNKTLNAGREQALKHLNELSAAKNQNDLVQQMAKSTSPTDQTSLAFKALGLDLPDGVHRINEAELNAIRSQGSLSDRAYAALLNWTTGQKFAPDILKDIAATAQRIANSKMKTANDGLRDVNRVYGYRVQGSGANGGLDEPPVPSNSPAPARGSLAKQTSASGDQNEPPRPANVPTNYVFKANGPRGRGWYKP